MYSIASNHYKENIKTFGIKWYTHSTHTILFGNLLFEFFCNLEWKLSILIVGSKVIHNRVSLEVIRKEKMTLNTFEYTHLVIQFADVDNFMFAVWIIIWSKTGTSIGRGEL